MARNDVYDVVTLTGSSELEIEGKGCGIGAGQLSGTIKDAMSLFMGSPVAKKEGFKVLSIAQSQSFNPKKNTADVTITIAFVFIGEESERPSQRFDLKKIEKLSEKETTKFPSRVPTVRAAAESMVAQLATLVEEKPITVAIEPKPVPMAATSL